MGLEFRELFIHTHAEALAHSMESSAAKNYNLDFEAFVDLARLIAGREVPLSGPIFRLSDSFLKSRAFQPRSFGLEIEKANSWALHHIGSRW